MSFPFFIFAMVPALGAPVFVGGVTGADTCIDGASSFFLLSFFIGAAGTVVFAFGGVVALACVFGVVGCCFAEGCLLSLVKGN